MADITKDSFDETLNHTRVQFQRGKKVLDFEMNEAQDVARVDVARSIFETMPGNPSSGDTGYKVVGTGALNSVTVQGGRLLIDGMVITKTGSSSLGGFTTPGVDRVDTVYLQVVEQEYADPAAVAQLGETSRRRRLVGTLGISTTGLAGVPASSATPLWLGGTHYYPLANIERLVADAGIISAGNVVDLRSLAVGPAFASVTRQSDFEVLAIVSDTYETESEIMYFDVDIANANPGARGWVWELSRDDIGGYRAPLSWQESTAISPWTGELTLDSGTLLMNSGTLGFSDLNIAVAGPGTSIEYVPVSESANGAGKLRISENPASRTLGGVVGTTSLLRAINGRLTVSCGDGVGTFGDFNGVSALSDALKFANAAGTGAVTITLKPGQYEMNASFAPSSGRITIRGEGDGPQAVEIDINVTDAFEPTNCEMTFENLRMVDPSVGNIAVHVRGTGAGYGSGLGYRPITRFINCVLTDCYVRVDDSRGELVATDTTFEMLDLAGGAPCLEFRATTNLGHNVTAYMGGATFERCLFISCDNNPAVRIVMVNGVTGFPRYGAFRHKDCTFYLASTTASAGATLDGNCGVLEVSGGDAVFASGDRLYIDGEVAYENCTVRANSRADSYFGGAIGTVSLLLHYVNGYPRGTTNPTTGTGATIMKKFRISGGTWSIPASDTAFTPFAFLSGIDSSTNTDMVVEDVRFDIEGGVDYGVPTKDVSGFYLPSAGGLVAAAEFGAFAFDPGGVAKIRNITVSAGNDGSNSGDLFFGLSSILDIDGVFVVPNGLGGAGAGAPYQRVRFSPNRSLKDVHREVDRLVVYSPGEASDATVILASGATSGATAARNDCDNFRASGWEIYSNSDATAAAVMILFSGAGGEVYKNISFVDGYFKGPENGFYAYGGAAADEIDGLSFERCTFDSNTTNGVRIIGDADLSIRHVMCRDCVFKSNTSYGFRIDSPLLGQMGDHQFFGNRFIANNGGQANAQAYVRNTNAVAQNAPLMTWIGNWFSKDGTFGTLKVQNDASAGAVALATPATYAAPPAAYGIYTAHSLVAGNTYIFTNGDPMILNSGELETP